MRAALGCAIALCLLSPSALADGKKKKPPKKQSVAECTSFVQTDREDEDGVDFVVQSKCDVKLSCGVQWALRCGEKKKIREGVAFELEDGQMEEVTASAAQCGLDGWEISDISWSCQPMK